MPGYHHRDPNPPRTAVVAERRADSNRAVVAEHQADSNPAVLAEHRADSKRAVAAEDRAGIHIPAREQNDTSSSSRAKKETRAKAGGAFDPPQVFEIRR